MAAPTPAKWKEASCFHQHPARLGPCGDLQAPLSAWEGGGGLDCCQPGQHLLPTPSPVTGAGWEWAAK